MNASPAATYVDMTDTIVSFAKPLLEIIPPKNEDQLGKLFERVIETWNVWVASSPPWNDSRGMDDLADALERGELTDADKFIEKILAERFLTMFRTDGRLVVDWDVTLERGVPVFHCSGCAATPELIAIMKEDLN